MQSIGLTPIGIVRPTINVSQYFIFPGFTSTTLTSNRTLTLEPTVYLYEVYTSRQYCVVNVCFTIQVKINIYSYTSNLLTLWILNKIATK